MDGKDCLHMQIRRPWLDMLKKKCVELFFIFIVLKLLRFLVIQLRHLS